MTNSWIPASVGTAWTVVFVLILLVHLRHAATMPGAHRLWHCGHLLMALGMIAMFAPTRSMVVSATAGTVVFVVAAAALAGYLVSARPRGRGVSPLWVLSVLDLTWMAYMFAFMNGHELPG